MASARNLMRVVRYDNCGGGATALKHVEVPIPTPKKDEILVKIEATCLNPADWKIQSGMLRPLLPRRFPFIPGTDISGEVMQIGAEVVKFKIGDKVLSGGGLAEYAVAKESIVFARPPEVSAAEGAALGVAGLTAYKAIEVAGIKLDGSEKQTNLLITAASGGVGHIAVQLAKLGNAHVTATCGARNVELVKSLGADEVMDYRTPEGAALKSPSGGKYDAVVHCASAITWSTFEPNLSERGKVIDLTPNFTALLTCVIKKITFSSKQFLPLLPIFENVKLVFLADLIKDGKLKIVIDSKYPLSEVQDAWTKCMDGHATGKIVVEP